MAMVMQFFFGRGGGGGGGGLKGYYGQCENGELTSAKDFQISSTFAGYEELAAHGI